MKRLFQLDPRLSKCAEFVRRGYKVVDIGTDHGLLPVWLARMGLVSEVLACDINPLPLAAAQKTIRLHLAESSLIKVETRLSDGLDTIEPWEADDIVIAGMGGELIAEIISRTAWLRDPSKHLILQPMTTAEALRLFLIENGFTTIKEEAVLAGGRPYTVMCAVFEGGQSSFDAIQLYTGKLTPNTLASRLYIEKQLRNLQNQQKAYESGSTDVSGDFSHIIEELGRLLQGTQGTIVP